MSNNNELFCTIAKRAKKEAQQSKETKTIVRHIEAIPIFNATIRELQFLTDKIASAEEYTKADVREVKRKVRSSLYELTSLQRSAKKKK